jgi:outer membrane lipopolysaccharide assembly protein LptE/RlpB
MNLISPFQRFNVSTLPTSHWQLLSYLLLFPILVLTGCGYTLGEIKPSSMRRVNTIAVTTFQNRTVVPRLEAQTADAVVKQFQQDGTYRIETSDHADAILTGTIVNLQRQPKRVYASNVLQTSEFELVLTVDYVLKDRITGALLCKGTATGQVIFFVNSDSINSDLVTDQNINYPIAAQRMAERLVSKVSEGW